GRRGLVDQVAVTAGGSTVFSDDVEAGADAWDADGFSVVTDGAVTIQSTQYYLVENRQYIGWDKALRYGAHAPGTRTPPTQRHAHDQAAHALHGRALPVPGRHARVVPRHVLGRGRRRQPAPGPGRDPPDRRQPCPAADGRRQRLAAAHHDVRRDLRPRADRGD